ncbi:PD-(D/E)XK nuclease family protein [Candidatus Woesearchaeota archaeon]|nr:PD-(D/E)XK nuclease family protein [Candidatus Woesearchaeota archaeon]
MTCYSHSRISTFEQCKYKYKLQYIDKVKVDVPTTVECFMGDLVHRSLEKLYNDLKFEKQNSKEDLISFFNDLWSKEWTDEILIVKEELSSENYRLMGEKYISMYYDHYQPFNQMTVLGLETQDRMTLSDGNQYHVRIDKLACVRDTYYVCDYKTNSRMKDQEEADEDRQLAMYSIWVKDKYKDAKKVVLLWHMLAFDKEAISSRTDEQLEKLHSEVVSQIKDIESCTEYPTNVTALCNYCVYKSMCPSFKHEAELEFKSAEEFTDDFGVQLVNDYAEADFTEKEAKKKKEELKIKLIEFAKQKEVDVVYGSNKKASVKSYDKVVYPEDKAEFIKLIKDKGLYDEISMISYPRLNSLILKKQVDQEVIDKTSTETDYRISLSKKRTEGEE